MFKSVDDKKIYEQVITQLQEMILSRKLKKGDKLPPERDLMEEFSVSRNSLREAISALTALGIIEKKQGQGTRISYDMDLGLYLPLALIFNLDNGDIMSVLSFRYILEVQIIKIILEIHPTNEFYRLDAILEKTIMTDNQQDLLESDLEFHTTLAEMTGNILITYFTNAIHFLSREQMKKTHNQFYDRQNTDFSTFRKMIYDNHHKILECLKKGQKENAIRELAEAFERAYPEHSFQIERSCL